MSTQDVHALTTTPAQLLFSGNTIRVDGDMVCLTDMWRADGDTSKRPSDWARITSTIDLTKHVSSMVGTAHDGLFRVVRAGGNEAPATFAHWHLALAYGRYLSPAFEVWCNTVVRAHMEAPKPLALPSRTESLRMALEASERADRLEEEVRVLTPKAEALDLLEKAEGLVSVAHLAKALKTGELRLFEWLRDRKILMSETKDWNIPYQRHLDQKHFELANRKYKNTKTGEWVMYKVPLITGKGVAYISAKYVSELALGSGKGAANDLQLRAGGDE
jgi:phage antirepressor YoqD-like protein